LDARTAALQANTRAIQRHPRVECDATASSSGVRCNLILECTLLPEIEHRKPLQQHRLVARGVGGTEHRTPLQQHPLAGPALPAAAHRSPPALHCTPLQQRGWEGWWCWLSPRRRQPPAVVRCNWHPVRENDRPSGRRCYWFACLAGLQPPHQASAPTAGGRGANLFKTENIAHRASATVQRT
jgi:hypothetical protein